MRRHDIRRFFCSSRKKPTDFWFRSKTRNSNCRPRRPGKLVPIAARANFYHDRGDISMTELEQAAVNFFAAVVATSKDVLGHTEFQFHIDARFGTKPQDAERAREIGGRIQQALNLANEAIKPLMGKAAE
jgi:hypothetical protein